MAVNVFIRFVQTDDSFRNEVNSSLYEEDFESLIHTSCSKRWFIQKLHTAVLGHAQQFCYGFKGNYVLCNTEQKQTILCLKYNTISTSYLLNCCLLFKSHLNSRYSGQSALVWYCCRCSCDIDDIQCLAKVFIPLHFFHILLCCCLMLNCFKLLFFPHINLHSIHHTDKAKTEFSQLRKCIKNNSEISTLHKYSYP